MVLVGYFPPPLHILQFINIPGTRPWELSHIPNGVPLVSCEVPGLFLPSTHPWMASNPRSFSGGPQPFVFPKSSNPLLNFQELPSWDLFDASHLPPSVKKPSKSLPLQKPYTFKKLPKISEMFNLPLVIFEDSGVPKKQIPHLGVSKNRGTPKRMVYMENPIKMDDLGVPPFKETSI